MPRTRSIAMAALLLLVIGASTAATRDVSGPLTTSFAGAEGWLTVWEDSAAVQNAPGTCEITVCAGWIIGHEEASGLVFDRDQSVLDAGPVWQVVVSGTEGLTGAVVPADSAVPELAPLPRPLINAASRRVVVTWTASPEARADVVACDRNLTCFTLVEGRMGGSATIGLASAAALVPAGVTVSELQVRVSAGDHWWWSAPVALPAPITGQG